MAAEPVVAVVGDSTCPSPHAVSALVQRFVPPEAPNLAGARVELVDRGADYDVKVHSSSNDLSRRYSDPDRDCERRARFAAVFAVLTLLPPELWPESMAEGLEPDDDSSSPSPPPAKSETPPTQESPDETEPPERERTPPIARLELAGAFEFAPSTDSTPSVSDVAAELRAVLGSGAIAGSLGAGYAKETHFDVEGVRLSLRRAPAHAGIRWRAIDTPVVHVHGDLGAAIVFTQVRGESLFTPAQDSAIELGARAEALAGVSPTPGFALFAAGSLAWFPSPHELTAEPQGTLAKLPGLWLGGLAGVALEL